MSFFTQYGRISACLLFLLFAFAPSARAQGAFTTINSVKVTPLSNGVQLSISADGLLQYRDADTSGREMSIFFPDARNGTGKNFFNVNAYPVSHLQLSTPQGAKNGIGVQLKISNLSATNGNLTKTADGQGVLLTIQSDRTVETKGGAKTGGAETATDTTTTLEFENGNLTLRAVRADIHQLVAGIAQKAGIAVAVDDSVSRRVSLNLAGVSPLAALRAIAAANGLAMAEVNGITVLSEGQPTDLATYQLSSTQSFRLQNTQAATASGLLPNFLYSYVKTNSEQNAVVVTAPTQVLAKIGASLRTVDTPSPQIAVEVIAVELSDATTKDLGLTIGNPDRNSFGQIDVGGGNISYSTIGVLPRIFDVNLRALQSQGRARVRARPQMAVVNGQTANLFIGAQRFILTQFNQSGQTQTRIQPVDVGVKLRVTPLTGGNGEITTRIAPEVSNITELDIQTGLPVLSTRRADTTVRVRDGETVVIGGLSLNQEQRTRGGVPFLGKLPLVGGLFRTRRDSLVRTELVIFVTPRILPPIEIAPVGVPPAAPTVVPVPAR